MGPQFTDIEKDWCDRFDACVKTLSDEPALILETVVVTGDRPTSDEIIDQLTRTILKNNGSLDYDLRYYFFKPISTLWHGHVKDRIIRKIAQKTAEAFGVNLTLDQKQQFKPSTKVQVFVGQLIGMINP